MHKQARGRWARLALPGLLASLVILTSGCGVSNLSFTLGKTHITFGKSHKHRSRPVRYLAYATVHQARSRHWVKPKPRHVRSDQSRYAGKLVAILDNTTPVFDQAASQGSSTEGPGLGDACNQFGDQISILESEFEGVPHPYAWYSKAGWMHHSFAGVYHEMLGALQECQTAASNQDDGALASAVSVMAAADGEMRHDDSYAHWLSKQG